MLGRALGSEYREDWGGAEIMRIWGELSIDDIIMEIAWRRF